MTETPEERARTRRRWISIGEIIAMAALVISGLGLWNSWQGARTGPAEVIEKKGAVPLVLRGSVQDEGKKLVIAPVEESHALDSLALAFPGGKTAQTGSDGALSAGEVESALGDSSGHKGTGSVRVTIDARYVEAGAERRSKRNYVIRYRWEGGGLFGGKSLRLTGFGRG